MRTIVALLAQLGLDCLFGWSLLSVRPHNRTGMEAILSGVLLGMYAETGVTAVLLFAGVSLRTSGVIAGAVMLIAAGAAYLWGGRRFPRFTPDRPQWFDWLAWAVIAEAAVFAVWQLARTPTFFSDALQHWSGRARSLYGGINWSFDPHSPFFMGAQEGNNNYPLLVVIWRAMSAERNGGWADAISRADSLVFFIVIVGTVWLAVRRFSTIRWLAAASAAVAATVPLQAWHAAAGYADIAVEAFTVCSLAAILRKEWFLAGVLAAGSLWCKNDGLFLYTPGLLAAVGLIEWRKLGHFAGGLATIAPWLAFNSIYGLGTTTGHAHLGWHPEAPGLLWNALVLSSTNSILWVAIVLCILSSGLALLADEPGRGLLALFAISFASILFVFSASNSFEFLQDETTVHRTMLQFSAPAILVSAYALSLKRSRRFARQGPGKLTGCGMDGASDNPRHQGPGYGSDGQVSGQVNPRARAE